MQQAIEIMEQAVPPKSDLKFSENFDSIHVNEGNRILHLWACSAEDEDVVEGCLMNAKQKLKKFGFEMGEVEILMSTSRRRYNFSICTEW